MIHPIELSTPKIVAISTVGMSIFGELLLSSRSIIADVPTQGWEHMSAIGIGGVAMLWLLRERENDKKEHKEQVAALVADLKSAQAKTDALVAGVIADNTRAIQASAIATIDQNKFFEAVARRALDSAFSEEALTNHGSSHK